MRQNVVYCLYSARSWGTLRSIAAEPRVRYALFPGDGEGVFYWPDPKGGNGDAFHFSCRGLLEGEPAYPPGTLDPGELQGSNRKML